jgi:hypothetical protein
MNLKMKRAAVGVLAACASASAFAFWFAIDMESDGGGGGSYGGYGVTEESFVTLPEQEVIGRRELITEWQKWNPQQGDILDMGTSFRDRSADSYGVELPSQAEKDEAAKKARETCRAGCASDQAKENAVCEATATQMRTATLAGGSVIWGAKRIPVAASWLRKFGLDSVDPAMVIAAGIAGANEYTTMCKGYAAGRYATCMNTGTCKG